MSTIATVSDHIATQLGNVSALKRVAVWQGNIEAMMQDAKNMPAAFIAFIAQEYEPRVTIGGIPEAVRGTMLFTVLISSKYLRSVEQPENEAYTIIESVRSELVGSALPAPIRGYLWPTKVEMKESQAGLMIYEMQVEARING